MRNPAEFSRFSGATVADLGIRELGAHRARPSRRRRTVLVTVIVALLLAASALPIRAALRASRAAGTPGSMATLPSSMRNPGAGSGGAAGPGTPGSGDYAGSGSGGAGTAPGSVLAGRLSTTRLALAVPTAFLQPGAGRIPQWRRIDAAAAPNGTVQLAWQGSDGVHVTPLRPAASGAGVSAAGASAAGAASPGASAAGLTRAGSDIVLAGSQEVGGLVARDDGFAVLTRRPDDASLEEVTAAHLISYRNRVRVFDRALTGTAGQDTAPDLAGQLAWNGTRYGAYFAVRGAGGSHDGRSADKLVYVSETGQVLTGGWGRGCSGNQGTALLPEPSGPFASLCGDDRRAGIFVSTGLGGTDRAPVVSREDCSGGSCGGALGGFVQTSLGRYVVAFGTRGAAKVVPDGTGHGDRVTAATPTHQVAVALLAGRSGPVSSTVMLTHDPGTDHVNVRLAPYGPNRLLLSYETVASARCSAGTCTGSFTGTHLRLIDDGGRFLTPDLVVSAHIAGSIAVLPNDDLVWAYAAGSPDYSGPLTVTPSTRTLAVARLAYARP